MEPKSIAFYTAVAVSILAVLSATTLSATTLPAMAQANTETNTETNDDSSTTTSQVENNNVDESSGSEQSSEDGEDAAASEDGEDAAASEDGEDAAGQSLSLAPSSSVLSCGETIETSARLTTDMPNCPEGFTITGENVVFDLNGHTISSGAVGDSSASQLGSAGITVANAVDAEIIGLGNVQGYGAGVRILASEGTKVQEVQLTDNVVGVDMIGATGADVSRSSLTMNDIGIRAVQSSDLILAFNQITANLFRGISFEGVSGQSVIAGNSLFGNGGQTEEEGGSGIYMDANTQGVNTDFNSAWANDPYDINHADGLSTSVTGNTFGPNNNCGTSIPAGLCSGQIMEET